MESSKKKSLHKKDPSFLRECKEENRKERNKEHNNRQRWRSENQNISLKRTQNSYWLFGIHAVTAALINPRRRYTRLLVTDEQNPVLREVKKQGIILRVTPEIVPKNRLEGYLSPEAVHQGVALRVHPLDLLTIEEALACPGSIVVLDHVTDPRNIGAILRSTAALGGSFLIVQERHAPEETAVLAKAASGALESVPIVRVVNISRALETLQKHGCWTIGLEAQAPLLKGADFRQKRVALVLGAEGQGLRRLVREHCDEIAGLYMPQRNPKEKTATMESLNVSIAAAIGLYEVVRYGSL